MALVKVLHDGFFKLAASPSTVTDQNNDGSDKCLLVRLSSSRLSHSLTAQYTASRYLTISRNG